MDRAGAFALVEAVQGEDAAAARAAAQAGLLDATTDVAFLLGTAVAIHDITRAGEGVAAADRLLSTAPTETAQAVALGLRALAAGMVGDTAGLLADASRAVALLDAAPSGGERCLAYVVAAASYNTLSLWELVDELYALALADPEGAALARQREAVAVNRVLVGLEHALALLEHGHPHEADERLSLVAEAVDVTRDLDLMPVMRADVDAAGDLVRLLRGQPLERSVDEHLAELAADDDVQVRPLLVAADAYAALQRGDEVAFEISDLTATSSARTFGLWVASLAAGGTTAYAEAVAAQLWSARAVVVAAAQAQLAAERRRAEHERLALAVHTDPLTGLHNRRRFDDWLGRGPSALPVALLLLDLDDFKQVNDRYGHACGDEVLRRIGLLLRNAVRPGDVATRQGGDEFAVVLTGPELDVASVQSRADALVKAVADEPWDQVRPGLSVTLSLGAAVGLGLSPQVLYGAADVALYSAKREGTGPVVVSPATPGGPVP